jgi:hypothetical protein
MVAESTHRLGLAADPCFALGVEALRLDERKRYITVQLGVVREIDLLLAALAKEAPDFIAATDK